MANEQSKRQSERQGERQQSTAIERAEGGERGLATRQYQDPFSLFDSLFERMQRDFFGASLLNALVLAPGEGNGSRFVRVPRMRMRDTGEALELAAELPGIDARNVSVQVEDDSLTISGEQREEEERDETRTERWLSFYRQIALPTASIRSRPRRPTATACSSSAFRKPRGEAVPERSP